MALDKPGVVQSKAASSLGKTNSGNISVQPTVAESSSAGTLESKQESVPTGGKKTFQRSQALRPPPKPLTSGLDAVKAAAVAAGARIASPSAAAAILKAQLKSAIHIKTTSNGSARPAHMGCYSNISPRLNLGSGHANSKLNTGPGPDMIVAAETSNGVEVKPSGSANSPVQADQVAGSGSIDRDEED